MSGSSARRHLLASCAAIVAVCSGCGPHWVMYSAPSGEFRIEFPAQPHEELFKRSGGDVEPCAVALVVRGTLSRSFEGGFHACRIATANARQGDATGVDAVVEDLLRELEATTVRRSAFQLSQVNGYEVWLKTRDGLFGRERLVVRGSAVFRWGLAAREEGALADASAERFMQSFVFVDSRDGRRPKTDGPDR